MIRMTRSSFLASLATIAWPILGHAQPAPAAEHTASSPAPAAKPSPHRCYWLVCGFYATGGGAMLKPLSSSREMELADVEGPASLAVQDGPIAGSGATVGSKILVAGSVGFVLPTESRRWALELVWGVPPTVKFQATGTLANMSLAPTALGLPTGVGPLGPDLGEAQALPVVTTVVYRLTDGGLLHPYLGAGPGVLFSVHEKITNPTLAINKPEMTIHPAPGIVLQGGLDVRLTKQLFARLDVKFIALMLARAEVHHVQVETPGLPLFDRVEVGTAKMNIWVNPLIVNLGVGYHFF